MWLYSAPKFFTGLARCHLNSHFKARGSTVGDHDKEVWGTLTKFMLALAVLAVVIFVVAGALSQGNKDAAKADKAASMDEAVAERIAPVAKVKVAGDKAAEPAAKLSGKDMYASACFACHGTGAAGAPVLGDKAAWSARIAAGTDALYTNAIDGKGGMPPKGGRADLSDDAIKSIVDYMVAESK